MFAPNSTVPQFIGSAADFDKLVKPGVTVESDTLEFKLDLGGWGSSKDVRGKSKLEFARDVAQFANAFGGCLVFGVEDGTPLADGRRVAGAVRSGVEQRGGPAS